MAALKVWYDDALENDVETPAREDALLGMEREKVGETNCRTCGASTSAPQCSRCIHIEELLEQLIRRQLRIQDVGCRMLEVRRFRHLHTGQDDPVQQATFVPVLPFLRLRRHLCGRNPAEASSRE